MLISHNCLNHVLVVHIICNCGFLHHFGIRKGRFIPIQNVIVPCWWEWKQHAGDFLPVVSVITWEICFKVWVILIRQCSHYQCITIKSIIPKTWPLVSVDICWSFCEEGGFFHMVHTLCMSSNPLPIIPLGVCAKSKQWPSSCIDAPRPVA